ncbi:MAG: alpha/beta hydrolase [Spirosomataceae bacterium]
MKLFRLLYLVLIVAWISACKTTEDVTPLAFKQLSEVAYGTDNLQKFDAYLPEGRTTDTPVLIFIHGGSWTSGDKIQYSALMTYFSDRKIAVFNINYRLATATTNKHPAQIEDVQNLINFIKQKATEYQISSTKFTIAGHSAGAHLALLYATKYDQAKQIKAAIGLASPTDFVEAGQSSLPEFTNTIAFFLGKQYSEAPQVWQDASPYYTVSAQSVPIILFHGQKDGTVPFSQSQKLKTKLDQLGVKNQLILYPNEDHIWLNDNLQDTLAKMADWVNTNGK